MKSRFFELLAMLAMIMIGCVPGEITSVTALLDEAPPQQLVMGNTDQLIVVWELSASEVEPVQIERFTQTIDASYAAGIGGIINNRLFVGDEQIGSTAAGWSTHDSVKDGYAEFFPEDGQAVIPRGGSLILASVSDINIYPAVDSGASFVFSLEDDCKIQPGTQPAIQGRGLWSGQTITAPIADVQSSSHVIYRTRLVIARIFLPGIAPNGVSTPSPRQDLLQLVVLNFGPAAGYIRRICITPQHTCNLIHDGDDDAWLYDETGTYLYDSQPVEPVLLSGEKICHDFSENPIAVPAWGERRFRDMGDTVGCTTPKTMKLDMPEVSDFCWRDDVIDHDVTTLTQYLQIEGGEYTY